MGNNQRWECTPIPLNPTCSGLGFPTSKSKSNKMQTKCPKCGHTYDTDGLQTALFGSPSTPAQPRADKRNPVIQHVYQEGIKMGLSSSKEQLNRFAIKRLLTKHTQEEVLELVRYAIKIKGEPYAPRIYNFMDLEQKIDKLKEHQRLSKVKETPTKDDGKPRIIGYNKLPNGAMQPIYEKIT